MATAVAAMTMMIMMMMIVVDGDLTTSHPLSSFGFTNETVSTTNGPVLGEIVGLSSDKPIYSYKSIPYASASRWQAPEDPEAWSEPLNATTFGPICPQQNPNLDTYTNVVTNATGILNKEEMSIQLDSAPNMEPPEMSEEKCLTLNVYSPTTNATANLPVMVWIHGGALITGSGQSYPPEAIVGQDIVLVTINYRLGLLGYFAHPELNQTNFGLQDQVKALEWVQQNIAQFGGDPDRVTIFGESAGGTSVLALMVSPLSEGLFSGAIAQSAFVPESSAANMSQAEELGVEVGVTLGIEPGAGQLENMKSLSADKLTTALVEMREKYGGMVFIYVDDGTSMPSSIWDGFKNNLNHQGVPLMIGSNQNETAGFSVVMDTLKGNWFGNDSKYFYANESERAGLEAFFTTLGGFNPDTVEEYKDMLKRTFGSNAEEVMNIFPVTQDSEARLKSIQVQTDVLFGLPSYFIAKSMANRSEPVFSYMFNQPAKEIGAFHGFDLVHIFNNTFGFAPLENQELADAMITYWTEFAKSGDPNTGGTLPKWRDFSEGAWQMLGPEVGSSQVPEDLARVYELAMPLYPDTVVPVITDGVGWPPL